jgi:hypothetical protein
MAMIVPLDKTQAAITTRSRHNPQETTPNIAPVVPTKNSLNVFIIDFLQSSVL